MSGAVRAWASGQIKPATIANPANPLAKPDATPSPKRAIMTKAAIMPTFSTRMMTMTTTRVLCGLQMYDGSPSSPPPDPAPDPDAGKYALLAGFIAVAAGALLPGISDSISTIFSRMASVVSAAAAA